MHEGKVEETMKIHIKRRHNSSGITRKSLKSEAIRIHTPTDSKRKRPRKDIGIIHSKGSCKTYRIQTVGAVQTGHCAKQHGQLRIWP
jgi:hypothetical protein